MSTIKSKKLQVGTDATSSNNFTIYQPSTPDGTLRIGVGNADSPTEVARFDSTGMVGGGKVLQVLQSVKTDTFSTTSTSYVDITGLTVSITPSSTSSKILVMYNTSGGIAGDIAHGYINIFRDGTELVNVTSASNREGGMNVFNVATQQQPSVSVYYLDSPSSTSSLTYQIKVKSSNGSAVYVNRSARDIDNNQYDGRSISTVTVMEVAG